MPRRRTVRAYVGLGGNVGDVKVTLASAVAALEDLPGVTVRGVSRLYATAPWGVADQPEFRNAVVAVDVTMSTAEPAPTALALLGAFKALERAAGRRQRQRWGPRELDLDLLIFGRHRISVERTDEGRSIDAGIDRVKAAKRLEVPHRDLGERLFVLAPLADLAPGLVPPGWSTTVETRRGRVAATDPPGSVRVVGEWDAGQRRWRRPASATSRSG